MQTEARCACLPTWLLPSHEDACNNCQRIFASTEKRMLCFFLYPCVFAHQLIHSIGITLHESCIRPFMLTMQTTGREQYVMLLPVQPEQLTPELSASISLECKQKHMLFEPKTMCQTCNVYRQTHTKFYRRAMCRQVHYCSTACQKDDWLEHKKTCILASADADAKK